MSPGEWTFEFTNSTGAVWGSSNLRITRAGDRELIENVALLPSQKKKLVVQTRGSSVIRLHFSLQQTQGRHRTTQHLWLDRKIRGWALQRSKLGQSWSQEIKQPGFLCPFATGLLAGYFLLHRRLEKTPGQLLPFINIERHWLGLVTVETKHRHSRPIEWGFSAPPDLGHLTRLQFDPLFPLVSEIDRSAWVEWDDLGPRRICFPHLQLKCERQERRSVSFARIRTKQKPRVTLNAEIDATLGKETDIRFRSFDGVQLAGTLEFPRERRPPAVVVLAHGSGPETRDSGSGAEGRDVERLPPKLFLDLSRHLVKRGLAVFRYDKRGIGESGGSYTSTDLRQLENDLAAAVRYVRKKLSLPVILAGFSEGANLALAVATRGDPVAGIVLAGGPARSLDRVMIDKTRRKAVHFGYSRPETRRQVNALREILSGIRKISEKRPDTRQIRNIRWHGYPFFWWAQHLERIPLLDCRHLKIPVLLLHGKKDLEVLPEESLLLAKEMKRRGVSYQLRVLPGLNHFFKKACLRPPGFEYDVPSPLDPKVPDIITAWVKEALHSQGTGACQN